MVQKSVKHRLQEWIDWLRPALRRLPEPVKPLLRTCLHGLTGVRQSTYAERLAAETSIFADQVQVHDLPAIFHYWSNTWLRPQTEAFGFSNPDQLFALYLQRTCADVAAAAARTVQIASLGCGNCDTEVRVAQLLVEGGVHDFVIDCIDINEAMLERGREMAAAAGVAAHITTSLGDFNDWIPPRRYDAVLANQSLHHVVNLEGLFAAIEHALTPDGRFITSDMIGRNGHMRWPEALDLVQEYWRELPDAYRRNRQLGRKETLYRDWDCSVGNFEGIRAQDILPLLIARFDFEFFFAYGNLIDPFIDRGFGPNFDADAEWDRAFIDRVHARDEAEIHAGHITPTHMMAVLRRRPYAGPRQHRTGLPPEACVRHSKT
jgi:SAM-dependent methyltransferase